jgi:nucleoid-associated protein YgaU
LLACDVVKDMPDPVDRHWPLDARPDLRFPADPASLDDRALERRMRELHERMRSMNEAADPTTFRNIQFEIRGLGREAVRRATDVRDSGHTYRAVHGDTLWEIAARHLGGGARWVRIFSLNCVDMRHGDILAAAATLKMPEPYRPSGGE